MDFLEIEGAKEGALSGEVKISGAKNAALPLIASSILSRESLRLKNLPNVADIKTLIKILSMLGAESQFVNSNEAILNTKNISNLKVIYDMVRKMRASILLLGPLLARFGKCQVSLPGGCAIGARPVDLHIKAMQKMGAEISIEKGYINASAPHGLKGAHIIFDKITVTGTENILMAAALARGKTTILNPAKEPEVIQLCEILAQSGIEISGAGSDEIHINGSDGELLKIPEICIIPDRIEAGTYLCAGAITNSIITIKGVIYKHLESVVNKLREIGFICEVSDSRESNLQDSHESRQNITISSANLRKSFELTTSEFPGFPTDMQAQFMALATQCEGVSIIEEKLFENRFMHANELQRLGANIALRGNIAKISGQTALIGADVMATDLRASSALVLAALIAQGKSTIHRIYHLDRGYENIERKLSTLGANIERKKD